MKPDLHLVSGWACPPSLLEPLAAQLADIARVTLHPFHAPLTPLAQTPHPWWLAGWSLGGLRALQTITDGHLQPDGLLLISSTARFCATEDYPHGLPRSRLRAMIRNLPRNPHDVLREFHTLVGLEAPHTDSLDVLQQGLSWLDTLDQRAGLANINCPVCIVHGQQDPIIPPAAAHYLADHLPNALLHLHPTANHALPIQQVAWLASVIRARLTLTKDKA